MGAAPGPRTSTRRAPTWRAVRDIADRTFVPHRFFFFFRFQICADSRRFESNQTISTESGQNRFWLKPKF